MKISNEVKEANVGVNVSLSNVELLVLNTELSLLMNSNDKLPKHISGELPVSIQGTLNIRAIHLVNLIKFLRKFTKDTVDLDQAHTDLFLSEGKSADLTIDAVNERIEASFGENRKIKVDNESI